MRTSNFEEVSLTAVYRAEVDEVIFFVAQRALCVTLRLATIPSGQTAPIALIFVMPCHRGHGKGALLK